MSVTLESARARGIDLPSDDDAAQAIIDEETAWLVRKIGPLEGERVETFYVGLGETRGRLGLRRYTDEVAIVDAGTAVNADHVRLIGNGSIVVRTYSSPTRWWAGPYVTATYTPNDELEVDRVLYDLLALAAAPAGPYTSEQLGSYSYQKRAASETAATRAALVSSLLPKRDQLVTLGGRPTMAGDPVINRPEPTW